MGPVVWISLIVVSVLCHLGELRKVAMQVHKLIRKAVMGMTATYTLIRFGTPALTGGFLAWTGRDDYIARQLLALALLMRPRSLANAPTIATSP